MNDLSESAARRRLERSTRSQRRVAQWGMVLVVVAAPLVIGGAPAWAVTILSAAALLVGGVYLLSRRGAVRPVPFAPALALATAAPLIELVPLPAGLVDLLSPQTLVLRTEALGQRPTFLPLTLDVPATVLRACVALACLAILHVAASATRSRGRTQVFVAPIALVGGLVAVISFVQRAVGATSILGLYKVADLPGSGFFGTFVNGNHAASLFTVSALVAWAAATEEEGFFRIALWASGVLSALGLLSTGSRAGVMSAAFGGAALLALWLMGHLGRVRGLLVTGAIALVGVPIALFVALGLRSNRLQNMFVDQKVRGWLDGLHLVGAFPWTGVGRGAFEAPATAYRAAASGIRLVYPENIVIQFVADLGIPLAAGVLALFLIPAFAVVRRIARWEPIFQAAACAVLAVLVHDLADFGLELSGVAFPVTALLGLVAGRLQASIDGARPTDREARLPLPVPTVALTIWMALIPLGAWACRHTLDVDGTRSRALVSNHDPLATGELNASIARHPADYYLELLAARQAMSSTGDATVLRHINRALRLFPAAPEPHRLAAAYLARLGRRSQAAIECRLAAEHGWGYSSAELLAKVGVAHVAEAVPQTTETLFELAGYLLSAGHPAEVARITGRAVMLDPGAEAPLIRQADLAARTTDKHFMQSSANTLLAVAASSQGYVGAANALAHAGDLAAAEAALRKGIAQLPSDGALVIQGAQILFQAGDLTGARGLLAHHSDAEFPVSDRMQAEELLAQIAEKEGNKEAASAARARVRLLDRLLQEHTSR